MSSNATKEMLKDVNWLTEDEKENIIKCVEEHHGAEKFYSIESEVVANADCYKFVSPKGILYYSSMLGRRFHDFKKELDQLEFKLNEKHNTISLDLVMDLYLKSDLPDNTYFQWLTFLSLRNYDKVCEKIIKDKVNKNNVNQAIEAFTTFFELKEENKKEGVIFWIIN